MATSKNLPRGIRNNNPLNLRISNNDWQGKVPRQDNTDGAFEQFTSLEYGIRAAMINIRTIINRRAKLRQKTTIRDLIHVWAPAADNNNETAYCQTVYEKSLISPGNILDIKNKNQICRLIWAMAYVENGQEISFGRVENAFQLAFSPASQLRKQKEGGQ